MNRESPVTLRWPIAVGMAALLVSIGAIGAYLTMTSTSRSPAVTRAQPEVAGSDARVQQGAPARIPVPAPGTPMPDVTITVNQDVIQRARIVVGTVESGSATSALRLPAESRCRCAGLG